jgi:hypothetical protein
VGGEDVAQDRPDLDLAQPGRRLGAPDEDPGAGQIDIAPVQVTELVRAGAGEEQRGEDRLALAQFIARIAVELGRGFEQRLDLGGAVDVDRGRAALAQAPSLAFGGVLTQPEPPVFDRDRECPLQEVDRPVDRPRREGS